jgi:hypothetical protein
MNDEAPLSTQLRSSRTLTVTGGLFGIVGTILLARNGYPVSAGVCAAFSGAVTLVGGIGWRIAHQKISETPQERNARALRESLGRPTLYDRLTR